MRGSSLDTATVDTKQRVVAANEEGNGRWKDSIFAVFIFLAATRIIVSILASVGYVILGKHGNVNVLNLIPLSLSQWDSGYYLQIAAKGYSQHGPEVAFFPVYPFTLRFLSMGQAGLLHWSGYLVSNCAFVASLLLLWNRLKLDFDLRVAWTFVITLSLFPTSFFFSAIYTESAFLLLSVIVYCLSVRQKYLLAALFVSIAAVTRITGLLLCIIPLTDLLRRNGLAKSWGKASGVLLISGFSMCCYMCLLWLHRGDPLAFLHIQTGWQRAITSPWHTLFDSFAVAAFGYGGNAQNWFMRAVSAHDLFCITVSICGIALAYRHVHRGAYYYGIATLLLLLVSHGPYELGLYSDSRYILILFPSFIGISIFLCRHPRLKWVVWSVSSLLLCFLTVWFGSGRWVA